MQISKFKKENFLLAYIKQRSLSANRVNIVFTKKARRREEIGGKNRETSRKNSGFPRSSIAPRGEDRVFRANVVVANKRGT